MSSYIVWRLVDIDHNLWLPTPCETFEQAADAWLECIQAGSRVEIMERIPIALRDARTSQPKRDHTTVRHGARNNSRASQIMKTLQQASGGLSRRQIAAQTGMLPTDVGSTLAGLMKRGLVRTEDGSPSEERGRPSPGRTTITLYFWKG